MAVDGCPTGDNPRRSIVDEQATVPASHQDLMDRPLIANFATVRSDGSVQSNPMWFVWDGSRVRLTHTRTRKKFQNVSREPRVALSIVDPEDSQRYLEIRGEVESIDDDTGAPFYRTLQERYGAGGPIGDADVRVVLVIRPTVILARSFKPGDSQAAIQRSVAASSA
jgi:PPOX class probable F420-dependent enzyme